MDANQADMKLVADLAAKSVTPTVIKDEREHFIVLPEGARIRSLRDFQFAEPPLKKAGKVTAEDVPSFAAYFQRFRDDDSMIFGLPERFTFTGILDYHIAKDGAAREKAHQVILELRQTARWKTWKGNNKMPMAQEQFAQFIEDNLPDIYAPDGTDYPPAAVMLEVSRSMQASSSYQFSQATNLKNGQRGLAYREQIDGVAGPAGELKIPDAFLVRIPIFLNQKPVEIICRLRFRIQGGKLSMWYDMLRVDEMLAAEFETARAAVAAAAECEVLLGAA